jgi:hypothetical protein
LDEAVFRRQGLIERTLAANSTYGAHVRTLRWTVLNTSGQLWGEEIRADSDDGDSGVDSEDVEVYTPEDGEHKTQMEGKRRIDTGRTYLGYLQKYEKCFER